MNYSYAYDSNQFLDFNLVNLTLIIKNNMKDVFWVKKPLGENKLSSMNP